mmetsp:Transcript_10349/g.10685  ORF Transcript_10349/g.10685 Transcript_10349/m.10685 type:complete len:183 (+) Transcript_10349:82-630(+)
MNRYLNNEFSENTKTTVGVEFGAKHLELLNKSVKVQIWDTAGQERYRSVTSAYYKGAKGVLVVYDISHRESFENIGRWINEIQASSDKDTTILILGNKSDLEELRQVTKEEAKELALSYGVDTIETSAKSSDNINEMFIQISETIIKKIKEKEIDEKDKTSLDDLKFNNAKPLNTAKKSSCC